MAKSDKPPAKKYKPFRAVRIPEPLALELDKLAARRFSTFAEEVRQAVREYIAGSGNPKR